MTKALSLLLTLSLVAIFSPRSFAAPVRAGQDSGTISGTGGMKVNGNTVQSGATVQSGNTIETELDGEATIDLGRLGRILLRPGTEIQLTFSSSGYQITVNECGSLTQTVGSGVTASVKMGDDSPLAEVASTSGQVTANPRGGSAVTLGPGESKVFDDGIESATAGGDSIFTVNCCECDEPEGPAYLWSGLGGLLALIGIGAGTATAIIVGDEDGGFDPGQISPNRP